jgi:hypothetical protein
MTTEWKSSDPAKNNGQYMPEGTEILMYNEVTGKMQVGYMYSSMGYISFPGVTHWMELPKQPKGITI